MALWSWTIASTVLLTRRQTIIECQPTDSFDRTHFAPARSLLINVKCKHLTPRRPNSCCTLGKLLSRLSFIKIRHQNGMFVFTRFYSDFTLWSILFTQQDSDLNFKLHVKNYSDQVKLSLDHKSLQDKCWHWAKCQKTTVIRSSLST